MIEDTPAIADEPQIPFPTPNKTESEVDILKIFPRIKEDKIATKIKPKTMRTVWKFNVDKIE